MKRFLKTLFLVLLVIVPVTFASAKKTTTTEATQTAKTDKVTMYVFYGSTCQHCKALEEYIATTLKKDARVKDIFETKYYEVWGDEGNYTFLQEVGVALGVSKVSGVPFIVIGDKYFSGYGESMNEEIVSTIKTQKENEKYVDVVASLAAQTGAQLTESNPEPTTADDGKDESKKNNIIGIIILVVTLGVIVVIIFTRHNDVEEVEEVADKSEKTIEATSTKKSNKTKK